MRYIAQKQMNVGDRVVMPGEDVPEAATWPNVAAYIDGGYLVRVLETKTDTAWATDIEARIAALERALGGPETSPPAEGADTDPGAAIEPIDLDNLKGISREELEARAAELGIPDAPKLGSKGAVATAINEAIAAREAQP